MAAKAKLPGGALAAMALLAALAGCQAPRGQPGASLQPAAAHADTDPCDAAHRDFMATAASYNRALPPASPPGPGDIATLRGDAEAADDALAGLVGTFGTLAACRSDVLALPERRAAHGALAVADATAKALAARLAAQQGGKLPPAPAHGAVAAAVLATAQPYLATDSGAIYDRPAAGGRPIASLRKGQRLTSSTAGGSPSRPGWLAIDLNDGSTGFVASDLVRPLTGRAAEAGAEASVTVVAIDLITEALPEKLAALQARLDAAEAAASGGS